MPAVTLLLVHGALLTSRIWSPVQSYLQNKGYNVVTLDVPGRAEDNIRAKDASLFMAADKVCKVVNMQPGPVIVVAHSQAGAIITQATKQCGDHISALVYVAAVVPHNGEKAFDLLSEADGENFDKVTTLDKSAGLYNINYQGPLIALFMADVDSGLAIKAINNMVAEPVRIGEEALQYNQEAFEEIPKFYIKTTADKIISTVTQEQFIHRDNFKKVYSMTTSHSPFISQPRLLGRYLAEIADGF
jgi:pimeloyl-ACP methyl ester carboxylesterase